VKDQFVEYTVVENQEDFEQQHAWELGLFIYGRVLTR
jgi:hypothetical protein